jgi:hypothetical protein
MDGQVAVMTEKDWWLFALFVAKRNTTGLQAILNLAERRVANL